MLMYIFLLDLDPSRLTVLEPVASALRGRCSDQLNYNPEEIKCTTYVVDLISFKPFYVDFLFELSDLAPIIWFVVPVSSSITSVDLESELETSGRTDAITHHEKSRLFLLESSRMGLLSLACAREIFASSTDLFYGSDRDVIIWRQHGGVSKPTWD